MARQRKEPRVRERFAGCWVCSSRCTNRDHRNRVPESQGEPCFKHKHAPPFVKGYHQRSSVFTDNRAEERAS